MPFINYSVQDLMHGKVQLIIDFHVITSQTSQFVLCTQRNTAGAPLNNTFGNILYKGSRNTYQQAIKTEYILLISGSAHVRALRRQPPAGLPVRPHSARAGGADAGAVENPAKPVRFHRPGRLQGARKVRRRKQKDAEGAAEGG